MILGVTDQRPREVIGTLAFQEPGRTEHGLFQRLRQRIPIEEYHHEDRRVLIVHVPERLPGTAWEVDGRYLKRAGDGLTALGGNELQAMFAETGPDFSAQPCPVTMSELEPAGIARFRERWAAREGWQRVLKLTDEALLEAAELAVDGQLTYTALILFGTQRAVGRYLAQSEVVFEYRSSDATGPAQDRAEFREGFFCFQDALWERINLRNDRQSYQDGLFRFDILTFDEPAVREALLNAVSHRDYRLGGSILLRQWPRRLEMVSPGGFPAGITPENIIDRQNPRNRRLAEALARAGLVERSGQGLNVIVESAIRHSKPLPDFRGSDGYEVKLTLEGTVRDPGFVRFLERLGDERLGGFSTHDFLTLDAIAKEQPLSELMRSRVLTLIDAGAIERQGRGRGTRYHLSRSAYAAIGKRGVYTRRRGLDHETNKELLIKHLRTVAGTGAPRSELCQVLPAQSMGSVVRLLQELRTEGRVQLRGERRWARWVLS